MIAIGADHGGYRLKEELKKFFKENQIAYKDFGTDSEERVDYPLIASEVAKSIQRGECENGILICKTGFGMCIVANKYKGIRCSACYDEETAKFSKLHNNCNILALGAEHITNKKAINIVKEWLGTEFEGGRHKERLELIKRIEDENMKQKKLT